MKKITLVITAMLIGLTAVSATEKISDLKGERLEITKRYRFMQPIKFVERGVEFLIFTNGEIDFNTEINNPYQDLFYERRDSKRSSVNASFGTRTNGRVKYTRKRGAIIQQDRFGRVRRVGNVFVNYDSKGRVKRVGSVFMKYRHGKLKQVGGLVVQYNRYGSMVAIRGHVNHHNQGCGFCGATSCSANHFDKRYAERYNDGRWYDDDYDDDMYYYGKKENTKQKKKRKRL